MSDVPISPRVEWALFCSTMERDDKGALTLANVANAIPCGVPLDRPLLLVASCELPGSESELRLTVRHPNGDVVEVPPTTIRAMGGLTLVTLQLPIRRFDVVGDCRVEFRFAGAEAAAHVARLHVVPIAPMMLDARPS